MIACAPTAPEAPVLADLSHAQILRLAFDWQVWARDSQLPPLATPSGIPWRTWLFLGGRGAGKTRAGAEWVRTEAMLRRSGRPMRIALVGPTIAHVRAVMVEGVSGLVAVHPTNERPHFEPSKNQLTWPGGAIAQLYSSEDPESLRGPQFDLAWCDELCRWKRAERTWDMLQLALRLGDAPRALITTTPSSQRIFKRLVADPTTAVTHATTAENAMNLAPTFLAEMRRRYGGTALGAQELDGEIIENFSGGLWRREWIEQNRAARAPELVRTIVAVDPPVSSNPDADACGIVVAGLGIDGRAYVLSDRTIKGREPQVWARAAVAAAKDFDASRIVAEVNQGGDLVVLVIHQVDASIPVRKVRATTGKWHRAEPVAALYADGRVVHVGEHVALENQLVAFAADGTTAATLGGKSPDRLDALVWAITDLLLQKKSNPLIRSL